MQRNNSGRINDPQTRESDRDREYRRTYGYGGISGNYGTNFYDEEGSSFGFYGKGPKGWKRSDERIRDDVCQALHDNRRVDASEIEISVNDGCVTMSGTVDNRDAKREAERCAERISGVQDVMNLLRVERKIVETNQMRGRKDRNLGTDQNASLS